MPTCILLIFFLDKIDYSGVDSYFSFKTTANMCIQDKIIEQLMELKGQWEKNLQLV